MTLKQTASQTVGPFFAYGLTPQQYGYQMTSIADGDLLSPEVAGERIRIEGRVFDGAGAPMNDAMLEIWQADAQGRYAHPADTRGSNTGFKGFGRTGTGTDPEQRFIFETIKPGSIADGQAPHINVVVFARGLVNHVYTRIYFSDEAAANAADAVFNSVPEERRQTLLATRTDAPGGPVYRFDIHMQGESETVFFDV